MENVLFGESEDKVEFLGINASAKLTLPQKVFGGFIENPPGVYAELTINTLDDIYAVAAGVKLYVIECTGELQIKIVDINDVKAPIPDKLHFTVGTEAGVPIVPPFLSLTKMGGGYEDLADSLTGDHLGTLPPLTLNVEAGIRVVEVLKGDFDLSISLRGMSLTGVLSIDKLKDVKITAGISGQWVDPWFVHMHGDLEVFEVIQGGVSVTIANNYFYGYGYVFLMIPEDIPIIGGNKLAGVEAAISNTMVGMNVEVLFVKLGVVYYWESGEVDFGDAIDLGSMMPASVMHVERAPFGSEAKDAVVMYGTNVRRLTSSPVEKPMGMFEQI